MLDETTPADESANTPANTGETSTEAAATGTAKKAAAKRTTAKKTAAKRTAKKAPAKNAAGSETDVTEEQSTEAAASADAGDTPVAKKAPAKRTRKSAAKKTAAPAAGEVETAAVEPDTESAAQSAAQAPVADDAAKPARKTAARKSTAKKTTARKTAAKAAESAPEVDGATAAAPESGDTVEAEAPAKKTAAKRTRKTTAKKAAAAPGETAAAPAEQAAADQAPAGQASDAAAADADATGTLPLFQAPEPAKKPARRTRKRTAAPVEAAPSEAPAEETLQTVATGEETEAPVATSLDEASAELVDAEAAAVVEEDEETEAEVVEVVEAIEEETSEEDEDDTPSRRRRRRGGRRRRKSGQAEGESASGAEDEAEAQSPAEAEAGSETGAETEESADEAEGSGSSSRRRRRRRRAGDTDGTTHDDPENTVVRVREVRKAEDQITAVAGSTRLEAKKQRRREGREAGRRRAPIVSEAEFLARREAVDRVMVIRQRPDLTQIAVLEDKVLVEHYVARESQTSLIGNVYLGRVQNVLPSMEAAFVDIGKGRNAVLYAGEVNWSALGHKDGQPRKIEAVLSPGQPVLVQVTKDPVGHKGARLTSQISLAGRFLVYVPDGTTSGISRKLPDTERARLKSLLKEIVPDTAGVIVRTAAEGASEDELTRDVERLKARWEDIELKARNKGNGAQLLYGEPDLTLKVVRDLFTEDFSKLVIEGDDAWNTVQGYVQHVAPDLAERLERYAPADAASAAQGDVFTTYRIDEQIAKGLDRKVWLPSGGSLIIDRTEAMTVVDVNTGKFTGSGGNLEETVTKNNLEAAEEIVRQLRLRDIGGIIVVDFIDMVLESNRDLVLRRLVECLGRDRTRHQVAEVTSLGLVQMTRKRIGTGLLEAFTTECDHCHGLGYVTHTHPVESKSGGQDEDGRRGRRNRGKGDKQNAQQAEVTAEKAEVKQDRAKQEKARPEKTQSEKTQSEKAQPEKAQQAEQPQVEHVEPTTSTGTESDVQDAQGEQAGEQEQQPSRRSRSRGRSRNRGQQTTEQATEQAAGQTAEPTTEVAEEPLDQPVPEKASEPEQEPVAAEPAEEDAVEEAPVEEAPAQEAPAAPTVVTRTRTRRGVSRPTTTGTPVAAASTPVVVQAPAVVVPPTVVEPAEESRPKVVTRTRGRAATRPAGAPEAVAPDAAPDAGAAGAVAEAEVSGDEQTGDESSAQHVPVKKKGTRKR